MPATHLAIRAEGNWQVHGTELAACLPGARLSFVVSGDVEISGACDPENSIQFLVTCDGKPISDQTHWPISVNSASDQVDVTIEVIAAAGHFFESATQPPDVRGLVICGVSLSPGATLSAPDEIPGTLDLEFIGDSVVAGHVIHGRHDDVLTTSDCRFTFAHRLAESLAGRRSILGFPGARLMSMTERLETLGYGEGMLGDVSPHAVVVNVGANDRTLSNAEYLNGMRDLIAYIRAKRPTARIVLLDFFRMRPNRGKLLRALARESADWDVYAFDTRPYLVGYSDLGVHPDVASHKRLSAALETLIRKWKKVARGEIEQTRLKSSRECAKPAVE